MIAFRLVLNSCKLLIIILLINYYLFINYNLNEFLQSSMLYILLKTWKKVSRSFALKCSSKNKCQKYLNSLQNDMTQRNPFNPHHSLFLEQDGSPTHYSATRRKSLDEVFLFQLLCWSRIIEPGTYAGILIFCGII